MFTSSNLPHGFSETLWTFLLFYYLKRWMHHHFSNVSTFFVYFLYYERVSVSIFAFLRQMTFFSNKIIQENSSLFQQKMFQNFRSDSIIINKKIMFNSFQNNVYLTVKITELSSSTVWQFMHVNVFVFWHIQLSVWESSRQAAFQEVFFP